MRNLKSLIVFLILFLSGFAFCSAQPIDKNIEFIPGQDSGFYYIIQKGDTLWDLSQKFYNSQWDWPGLWELNPDIKNPHWIYPGNKIRIYLKDKAKLKPVYVEVKKKPVEKKEIKTTFSFPKMDEIGFIRKKQEPSLGEIIRDEDGNLVMSEKDIIYIKPSGRGSLVAGKTYQIFSAQPVKENIAGSNFKGIRHLIKGKIKILGNKVNYVSATITENNRAVTSGDQIMAYFERPMDLVVQEHPPKIDARMICSEDDHLMINNYIIGFINAGKSRVKPGQIYSIYHENTVKDHSLIKFNKEKSLDLENIESGRLIVLHTEDIASTVMVLSSRYAIRPDDIIN